MRYTPAPIHPVTSFVRSIDYCVWATAHALAICCAALLVAAAVVEAAQ